MRTHQFYDDDVQLAGVFVLPGEVSATQSSIAGQGQHECFIGTQVCVSTLLRVILYYRVDCLSFSGPFYPM